MSKRSALAWGAAAVACFGLLAYWSGVWSPFARQPMLDGTIAIQPYRWVSPPSDLASTNQPPTESRFRLAFDGDRSKAEFFVTDDAQVTLILPKGVFRRTHDATGVELVVTPLDPATLDPLPDPNVAFGNAYELSATSLPRGQPVTRVAGSFDVILIYPVTPDLLAATHSVALSKNGPTWTLVRGSDSHQQQQAQASIASLGTLVVAGEPAPTPSAETGGGGGSSLRVVALVVAACVLLVGIGLVLRSRRPPS